MNEYRVDCHVTLSADGGNLSRKERRKVEERLARIRNDVLEAMAQRATNIVMDAVAAEMQSLKRKEETDEQVHLDE